MSRERKRQLIEAVIEHGLGLSAFFGALWAFCKIAGNILAVCGVA